MKAAILGADGYIGWHLATALAARGAGRLLLVDSGIKRSLAAELGTESAIPIASFPDRVEALRARHPACRIDGVEGDVSEIACEIVADAPDAIYHLAQIPSAAYSMAGFGQARRLVVNNELGHLALLHAVRAAAGDVHIIKMGSMGEYADLGLPIPDGYCSLVIDGVAASRPWIFPREAGDLYHVCKINETNHSSLACRVWGLRITEVMLSTVFGTSAALAREDPRLAPRLDLDPVFGTVIHRFVAQRISGAPMTVYGGGLGLTGLTSLQRTLEILTRIPRNPPPRGTHDIVNVRSCHKLRVRRLAEWVDRVALDRGHEPVDWATGIDPRHEAEGASLADEIETRSRMAPAVEDDGALSGHLHALFEALEAPALRLDLACRPVDVDWRTGMADGPEGGGRRGGR